MITRSEENYLKTIFSVFMQTQNNVSTNEIANLLETSPASVTEMIKKLQDKNLVLYEKYNGVRLSKVGEEKAIAIIRKHRLWETFLVKKMNFNWGEVHDIAEQLEHIQSPELVDRLDSFLGFPKFDPHGEPIPTREGKIPAINTIPLSQLELGTQGKIIGVTIDEKSFLDYLTKLDISIGSKIKILEKNDFDQSLEIKIDDTNQHISNNVAEHLLIKIE